MEKSEGPFADSVPIQADEVLQEMSEVAQDELDALHAVELKVQA